MKVALPLISALLLPWLLAAGEREKFIYKTVGDEEIELYVSRSEKTDGPSPAIVWYYGSGLNKRDMPPSFLSTAKF